MAEKDKSTKTGEAGEVFRQFAWNLAGTLARPAGRRTRPAAPTAVKR